MNKVAIVTGASSGIGEATARRFALAGWRVALAARSEEKMEGIARQLRERGAAVIVVGTDVTERAQIETMVERTIAEWGRVDLLVNNAGAGLGGTVASVGAEQLEGLFQLNVFAPVYALQAVVPHMREQGGGVIVNVSSMVEKFPAPIMGPYAASKIALSYLSDAARAELDRDGIKVVTVLPGATDTLFFQNSDLAGRDASLDLSMMERDDWSGPSRSVPPSEVAEMIWRAVQRTPRQATMNRSSAVVATLAPLAAGPFVRGVTWLLNRYVPRRGETPPASPGRDLALLGASLGTLTLGTIAINRLKS